MLLVSLAAVAVSVIVAEGFPAELLTEVWNWIDCTPAPVSGAVPTEAYSFLMVAACTSTVALFSVVVEAPGCPVGIWNRETVLLKPVLVPNINTDSPSVVGVNSAPIPMLELDGVFAGTPFQ